jgi:hypothetical protein
MTDMGARDLDSTELRADCPREVIDVLDAISLAQRLTRNQLVLRILHDWARDRRHEASLVARLSRGNLPDAENSGGQRP